MIVEVEITTSGTEFEANDTSKDALGTLFDGDLWMIYRNIETDVLHWDFVRCFLHLQKYLPTLPPERAGTLHQLSSGGRAVSLILP